MDSMISEHDRERTGSRFMTVGYGHHAQTVISAVTLSGQRWVTAADAPDTSEQRTTVMLQQRSNSPGRATLAAIGLFAIAGVGSAHAGTCPADKIVPNGQGQAQTNAPAKSVTDTVIGSTDLAKEPVGIPDRLFRLRKLVVEPGGVVPWHRHGDRPAMIYIISGEITEYSSTCVMPIVHRAGDTAPEIHTTSHWWKNTGSTTVTLLSADLLRVKG
jgi:quercetin dioxygenase-like cupin family protein